MYPSYHLRLTIPKIGSLINIPMTNGYNIMCFTFLLTVIKQQWTANMTCSDLICRVWTGSGGRQWPLEVPRECIWWRRCHLEYCSLHPSTLSTTIISCSVIAHFHRSSKQFLCSQFSDPLMHIVLLPLLTVSAVRHARSPTEMSYKQDGLYQILDQ